MQEPLAVSNEFALGFFFFFCLCFCCSLSFLNTKTGLTQCFLVPKITGLVPHQEALTMLTRINKSDIEHAYQFPPYFSLLQFFVRKMNGVSIAFTSCKMNFLSYEGVLCCCSQTGSITKTNQLALC